VVKQTTGRPFDSRLPLLSTPAAPGPGVPACAAQAPPLLPRDVAVAPEPVQDDRPRYRYRGRFSKSLRLRFLSHLDIYRLLLRALRRAEIPLVYSQGFNPKPRVAFGPALSVGVASEGEYIDFDSYLRFDPEAMTDRINAVLPKGVRFETVLEIGRDVPTLGEAICAARYRVSAAGDIDPARCIDGFRQRSPVSLRRERKGKLRTFNLDNEMLELTMQSDESVRMTLALHSDGASVRPEEALREIFGESTERIGLVREELLVEWRGRMINPLLAASVANAHRAVH
jgi:radical SAM-linked protein